MSISAAATPLFVAEFVYHVEYISNSIGGSSHANNSPLGSLGVLEKVLRQSARLPMYRSIFDGGSKKKRKLKYV